MRNFFSTILAATLLCSGLSASTPGAVFTTGLDGAPVNGNIYEASTDVYLNGGPGAHGKCGSAGLDDGDYYFVVTDPSTGTLLSTDAVTQRKFRVSGGAIVSYLGSTHFISTGKCNGNITVQLSPYAKTPNPGGEYKVSVSKDPAFPNSATKSDNWKIRTDANCLSKSVKVCVSCPENINIPCTSVNGTGVVVNFTEPIVLPLGTPVVCNPPSGSFFPVGTTTVTAIAANAKGQTAACAFTVTVGDCPQYHLACPPDISVCAPGSGVCTATGLFVIPAGDDLVTVTADHQPSEAFPLGTTVVTLTAKQGATVLETCAFSVTVRDCSNGVICGHVVNTDTHIPIGGWRLVLSGAGNGLGYTDASGSYCFSSLTPGVYTVTELPPVGCWYPTTDISQTLTVGCENASNRFDVTLGQVCRCGVQY